MRRNRQPQHHVLVGQLHACVPRGGRRLSAAEQRRDEIDRGTVTFAVDGFEFLHVTGRGGDGHALEQAEHHLLDDQEFGQVFLAGVRGDEVAGLLDTFVEDAEYELQRESLAGPARGTVAYLCEVLVRRADALVEHLDTEAEADDREIHDVALQLFAGKRTARGHVVGEMPDQFLRDGQRVAQRGRGGPAVDEDLRTRPRTMIRHRSDHSHMWMTPNSRTIDITKT